MEMTAGYADPISEAADFETEFYGERELRWYQVAAINAVAAALQKAINRILIVLPTGAGKTLTIAAALSDSRIKKALGVKDRPLRVLFAAHIHRLLTQAEQTFVADSGVEIITQSIFSEIPAGTEWDVTVLDESHHEACSSFQYHLEKLGDKPIIGLTATPDRADGCLIKFEEIINPISREQAVAEGFLAPTFLNTIVDAPSKSKVPVSKMIIDHYGHEFGQTMMFFRTKAEVREIAKYLTSKGYVAIGIVDQTPAEIDHLLNEFSEKKIQFLITCNRLNEGIDVKGCTDVYLGRQVGSYPLLNQIIGRAARPDSDCNVWELINPISATNLDTTVVVGTPERHRLIDKHRGQWREQEFDYTSTRLGSWSAYAA